MSWQAHIQAAENLDSEDPRRWQMIEQFVQAVGAQFLQGHQIVQNRTDGEIELRGRFHDFPVRFKLDMSFFSPQWELKGQNPANATLYLHWDLDAVPNVGEFRGDVASDWDDADPSTKYFFGKGFYLDASNDSLDRELAFYQSIPEAVRQTLGTYMVSDRIMHYYVYGRGDHLLYFKDELHELADPLNQIARGAWLMAQVAWGVAQVDVAALPAVKEAAAAGTLYKMTCAYCGTLYLWSQNQACPNCGAPPRG